MLAEEESGQWHSWGVALQSLVGISEGVLADPKVWAGREGVGQRHSKDAALGPIGGFLEGHSVSVLVGEGQG